MKYTIDQIAQIIGARRIGQADCTVNWLLTDSRSLCFPEETLFFALKTPKNDGHKYIDELIRRGVKNFVVEAPPTSLPGWDEKRASLNVLIVPSSLHALQQLAAYHRSKFQIPIIGITGSNGKTTVKEWLYQLLSPDFNICRSPRSYNSQVGVPLSVWLLSEHHDLAIFETGISQPGEMERLEPIVRPTIGVMTNLGMAHQENFLSIDIKCSEKMQLFRHSQQLVVCSDDEVIHRCASLLPDTVQSRQLHVTRIEKGNGTATVFFEDPLSSPRGGESEASFTIPFIDDAAIQNSITCMATILALNTGIPLEAFCQRMAKLEPVAMRLEVKEGIRGCILINDTYNSDEHSLDIALDFMSRRPTSQKNFSAPNAQRSTPNHRTLILSDILQSGESPHNLYSRVAQTAHSRGIGKAILVGETISQCADFFPMEHYAFRTTDELLRSDCFRALHDEFILIKGARQFEFDRVCDLLTLKVHQTILEVNLSALRSNVGYYRQFMKPQTRMVCMVKASAYGMGAFETSKTLQDAGVDYLAVAVADEGADLRKAGVTAGIMVMNPELTSFKMLFDYRLEPEVFSFDILEALIRAAEKHGIMGFPIHIKLDTGMHRLGFDPRSDIPQLIDRLSRQTALVPCSIFSHFVGSDSDAFDDFSRQQFALFDQASRQLQAAYGHKILRHICNSAAIEHFPEYHLDMVRLGLGLYGIDPRSGGVLNNVATLKTTILQIRDVPAGDSVGYSRRTVLDRPSRIAAIPIGYADGLDRHLGNRHCYCLVNGQRADYVGNICMDVCMIDVTDIPCQVGDRVTIFGDDLPVSTLSDVIGTIPYEVLTGISTRVQHVYVEES